MPTPGINWTTPPSQIAKKLEEYGRLLEAAVKDLGDHFAQKMQNEMRQGAPWEDRTGAARSGLFAIAELEGKAVVIYASHTVEYGKYLEKMQTTTDTTFTGSGVFVVELIEGGKYAIIIPTIQKNIPEIEAALRRLLTG